MTVNQKILRTLTGDPLTGSPGTHMHVIGSSGKGKSKFLESLIRDAITERHGLCVIDWGGDLFPDLLDYLSYLRPKRDIFLLNPSDPQFITPYNPFVDPGDDPSTTVSRRINLTVKPWGAPDTNQTPRLERICRIVYTFAIAAGETLPNAAVLLEYGDERVYKYALRILDRPEYRTAHRQLQEMGNLTSFAQWYGQTESTDSRFTRFLGPMGVRRFIGMKEGNLDIEKVLDRNAILLVNLQHSGYLDDEAARLFAALLLNDIFSAARKRPKTMKRFLLFLDEFQEYMSVDLARMLDQVRKGGVHLVMAHQHLGHLANDEHLRKSIFGNAQIKAVFGGVDYEDAVKMAHEIFLNEINERDVVETIMKQEVAGHTLKSIPTLSLTRGRTSSRTAGTSSGKSRTHGSSQGASTYDNESASHVEYDGTEGDALGISHGAGSSENASVSRSESVMDQTSNSVSDGTISNETLANAYFMVPEYRMVKSGDIERSRDDRVGKIAALLKDQPNRQCYLRIKQEPTFAHKIPPVRSYVSSPAYREQFVSKLYSESKAISAAEADRLLEASRQEFLASVIPPRRDRASSPADPAPSAPTKKPF